jgi:acetyl-CoA carboxylase carboxyl transferase subunit beta
MARMAWFKKERKPRTTDRVRREIPADAWEKCDECGHIDIRDRFTRALNLCPNCGHHRRIGAQDYVDLLIDEGSWHELDGHLKAADPLRFENYEDRLQAAVRKAGPLDALRAGFGRLDRLPVNLGVMDFAFMGGSMGAVVGEKVARLARRSIDKRVPLVIVSASGGARMQEGVLSLMQMAKTSVVLAELASRRVPFVSILTNPTTGGVSASYAMQGDVIIAEPGAVVGFAGPRVIKQTIGQDLPPGFQTAEFLLEHGMVDLVVPRTELKGTTAQLLRHMTGSGPAEAAD